MCAYAYVVSTIIYQIGGLITGELTFGVGTVVAIAFIALIIFLLFRVWQGRFHRGPAPHER